MTKYNVNLEFEIISEFQTSDRLKELDMIPKTPNNNIDYQETARLLCEKDGGRLLTVDELQLIAVLQKNKLINIDYSGFYWSSTVHSTLRNYGWCVYFSNCNVDYTNRGSNYRALCVRDLKFKNNKNTENGNYYVYSLQKGKPTIKHNNFEDAVNEAKRLSIKENKEFEILKSVAKAKPVVAITSEIVGVDE